MYMLTLCVCYLKLLCVSVLWGYHKYHVIEFTSFVSHHSIQRAYLAFRDIYVRFLGLTTLRLISRC